MNIQSNTANPTLPLLDLDILKTFIAIAETKSFSKAADIVHRTPSAVSMQVRKLEDMLGRSLFKRDARSVSLTLDGELLMPAARSMLALNRETISKFITPEISGVITLGSTDDFISFYLPQVLARITQTHPNVVVDVVVDHSTQLSKRFARGELDVVIVNSRENNPFIPNAISVFKDRLEWVGLCGGSAHLKRPLPVSMWDSGCPWSECAMEGLKKAGIDYRTAFVSGHVSGQKAAIRTDLAVAPMARNLIEDDMVALPPETGLPELDQFSVDMAVKDDASQAARTVAQYVQETIGKTLSKAG